MNKTDQRKLDALQEEIAALKDAVLVAKALRFTEPCEPDVAIPEPCGDLKKGWAFNEWSNHYDGEVAIACTTSSAHAFRSDTRSTTKGERPLYSTKLLALRGLRHALENIFANKLANIDRQIIEEQAGNP